MPSYMSGILPSGLDFLLASSMFALLILAEYAGIDLIHSLVFIIFNNTLELPALECRYN